MDDAKCKVCNGSGLVPLPRGMSGGFYAFMTPGCIKRDDGTNLMRCYACNPAPAGKDEDDD